LHEFAKGGTEINVEMAESFLGNNLRLISSLKQTFFYRSIPSVNDLQSDSECSKILREVVARHYCTGDIREDAALHCWLAAGGIHGV
jgi:hypothetical protein